MAGRRRGDERGGEVNAIKASKNGPMVISEGFSCGMVVAIDILKGGESGSKEGLKRGITCCSMCRGIAPVQRGLRGEIEVSN